MPRKMGCVRRDRFTECDQTPTSRKLLTLWFCLSAAARNKSIKARASSGVSGHSAHIPDKVSFLYITKLEAGKHKKVG